MRSGQLSTNAQAGSPNRTHCSQIDIVAFACTDYDGPRILDRLLRSNSTSEIAASCCQGWQPLRYTDGERILWCVPHRRATYVYLRPQEGLHITKRGPGITRLFHFQVVCTSFKQTR